MSAKAMGRVWDLDLPHNKRLVLLAMADHADHDGRNIYPSTDLIAWKTGYSDRQVQRIIDALITDGILVIVKPARQQHPTTFDMNLSAGTIKPPFDRPQGRQNVTPKRRQNVTAEKSRGDISTHPGVTSEAPRGDIAMSPKPWNHPIEPPTPMHDSRVNGGGDDRTFLFLTNEAIGAAAEFADLDYDLMRADYDARRKDGQSKANIVRAWRLKRPTSAYHYAPATTSTPLAATRPNIPESIVSPAEVARRMRERR